MKRATTLATLVVSLFVFVAASSHRAAHAELLYALTDSNMLVTIDSNTAQVTSSKNLTGLGGAELIGIDFRPATGELYGFSTGNQFYKINPATGSTSTLGSSIFMIDVVKAFDFDPVNDQIRLVTNLGKNFRINPNDATLISNDSLLNYAGGDPNAGVVPQVVHAAYTNSFPGASTTTLFNLEAVADALTMQTPENDGTLNTVGSLGVALGTLLAVNGMDISGTTGTGYVVGKAAVGPGLVANTLYTVDLNSGALSPVAPVQMQGFSINTFDKPKHDDFGTLVDVAAVPGVPEPSTFVLAGFGGLGLVALAWRRRRAARRA
ncbi:MAG: DUF4394 domain-containing protein [Planctomycetota bacterium]|nr:MAG: DUF4394 domain-containing protein [Planctomycetota bacterium]